MNELKVSIIIPAHNEERNLPATVSELQGALRSEKIPYEIIIVNDCSSDGTAGMIAEMIAGDSCIRTISRTPPGGFGRAIRAGLALVEGEKILKKFETPAEPKAIVAAIKKVK